MISDLKKALQTGVNEILEDILLESNPVAFLEKLGMITSRIGDLRIEITLEHFDPAELTMEDQLEAMKKIINKLENLKDD